MKPTDALAKGHLSWVDDWSKSIAKFATIYSDWDTRDTPAMVGTDKQRINAKTTHA